MDIEAIEAEAKLTAAKHVANMLQRPDQLEKVEQYMRRESRKKSSVEAMLKTAMQTQLDGVKTGLHQLQTALQETKEIKHSLKETEETLVVIPKLVERLRDVKEESIRHSQYAAAMENLKHIFNVPESVQKTQEWINDGKLLLAHQSLTDLENSRDDLLFEMHKLPKQSPTEKNMLKHYFSDVEKLSEELSKQLWLVLGRTLNSARKEPQIIVTALRIIEREECIDRAAEVRHRSTGYLPIGRPKRWRKKAFDVLRQSVLERIEGNQFEDRSENKMWLVRHLEVTRQLVIEDLKVVKTACVPCFPSDYNIFFEFVKMYHENLSKHLQDVIAGGLEGNEYITLLNWLNTYESPEMLGHPDLNIDVHKMGPLLTNDVIDSLMKQYLSNLKINYQDWMKNSLSTDFKDWQRDIPPEQNGDGIFHTSLPVIVFNMLDQNLQVAQTVSQDLVDHVMTLSIRSVYTFTSQYEEFISDYKRRHFENRSMLKYFTFYMIAIANNSIQFEELAVKLKQRYVKASKLNRADGLEELFAMTLDAFKKIRSLALKYLQEELFLDLSPHLNDVVTRKWLLTGREIVDIICVTLEDYCGDYMHLWPENFNALLSNVQKNIATSYIQSLLQRKITFKTYEERKQASEKICDEGKKLQMLFERLSPFHVKKGSPFEALSMLVEVIKLKDISMLSLEISGVLKKYPDMTHDQLVSLILIRGDMGKGDARQLVTDIMNEVGSYGGEKTVFSDIMITL